LSGIGFNLEGDSLRVPAAPDRIFARRRIDFLRRIDVRSIVKPPYLNVCIFADDGSVLWSFQDGPSANGTTSTDFVASGTQQRIIDALLAALIQARAQLSGAFDVLNVVPYGRPSAAQIDHCVPVS
jgi:hypothetical protein